MKELENIRDHVNYLRRFIPRSEWTRDDQRIVHLSAKIAAVLRELDVKRSEPRDDFDRGADAARAMIRRAIEEAGK